jgi:hypothetical protein
LVLASLALVLWHDPRAELGRINAGLRFHVQRVANSLGLNQGNWPLYAVASDNPGFYIRDAQKRRQ